MVKPLGRHWFFAITVGGIFLCGCGTGGAKTGSATTVVPSSIIASNSTTVLPSTTTPPLTSIASASITVAEQVQACEQAHGMSSQYVYFTDPNTGDSEFQGCQWPPASGSDADGHWTIQVTSQPGPESTEASDADLTYIINATCPTVQVIIQMGSQGTYTNLPPVVLAAGAVTSVDNLGQQWTGPSPYPYPPSFDIEIVANSDYGVSSVSCLS